jgi:hypothetical protein
VGQLKKLKYFQNDNFGQFKDTKKNEAPAFYRMQHRGI